ncbi:ABC transporter substrate-binding protein [Halorubrum tibetense]|uniref:ABC transporter substrate-binding protein n=1 Tax=Halorubrum tibetense TaxID=175631 RepID=A0ABD5SA33_9EURY
MLDSDPESELDSTNRRRVLGLLGGGTAVALAGCADDPGDDDDGADDDGADDDGTDPGDGEPDTSELNLINSTFDELDPIMSTDTASSAVITQLYENLTAFPNGVPEIENQLLEEFDVSEDGTTWTFTVRDDVTFHDGSDVTADDVVYSWRRTVESPNTERRSFSLNQPVGLGIDVELDDDGSPEPGTLAVEAVDDQTVELELVGPNPDALDVLAYSSFSIIPEGYVGDIEGYDGEVTHQEFSTEVANGTGPFELDYFDVDEEVRVVRNDDYYGHVAEVPAVHWEIIEDDQAAWTYALEQNADIFEIPTFAYEPDAIDAETDDRNREVGTYGPAGELNEEVNYIGISELSTFYFGFNASNTDRAVRQAVAYVLDKEQVVEDVFAGRGTPAYSFLPPGIWPTGADGYNSFVDDYPYSLGESDLQGAQSVLEDAGFTADDPAEITLTTYVSEVFETAAELIRDLLAGSGVDMELEQSEFSVLQNRGEDGDLEMYTLGWIWSWPAAPYGSFQLEPENTNTSTMPGETDGFYLDWHTQLGESDNADKAQEAWERAVDNPLPEDEGLRQEAYVEMEEAVRDDAVLVPLYHGFTERFWYDYVDVPATGALGAHWQQYNTTTIEQ